MRLHEGEAEATGWRVEKLADVGRRLCALGRPALVAVDGRGGAGKSTLVERLRQVVPRSAVVHTDDIAWNQAYFDWADLIAEHVLRPLRRGGAVEFRPPAWIEHHRPGAIRVPAGMDVVWVEGTGIIRADLAGWFDASVWLQGDLDEQERRLVARDGDSAAQRRHVRAWPGRGAAVHAARTAVGEGDDHRGRHDGAPARSRDRDRHSSLWKMRKSHGQARCGTSCGKASPKSSERTTR